jgi:multidrug efflux pump subunit AcrA (membrane-fusion protein)
LLGLAVGLTAFLLRPAPAPSCDVVTEPATYRKMQPTIVARGDVESAENSDIVCRVRSWVRGSSNATTIKWAIDNGVSVHRGQLVCELDDSAHQETLKDQKGPLEIARAEWVFATENCRIVDSQNQSDIQTAEVAVRLADLDLQKYLRGDYEQARKDLESRLLLAESDVEMWRERTAWTQRMVRKGFLNSGQARTEEAGEQSAQLELQRLCEEYRVLQKYTKKRMLHELQNRLAQAKCDLRRVKLQARAKEAQADAARLFKERVYQQRLADYREIETEIKKCTLTAPNDGIVVYALPPPSWAGAGPGLVAAGEPVSTGQRLMSIPNLNKMQVKLGVHEAQVGGVHGEVPRPASLDEPLDTPVPDPSAALLDYTAQAEPRFIDEKARLFDGEPALIRLQAYPEQLLRGHVRQVAPVASQLDSPMRDIHVYATQVAVDDRRDWLRPDMSAEVTILEKPLDHVLAVPLRAVLHAPEQGDESLCFVVTPEGPQERSIHIGRHTDELAEVRSGLRPGEHVVVNPQSLLNSTSQPIIPTAP